MSRPSKTKRRPTHAGDLIPPLRPKTSARTEAAGKKRHSYRSLPRQFQRHGFQYRQIAREVDAAIYEQTWTGYAEPAPAYEVIRIRRRDGFQIGLRFIPPAEVYPRSEQWGQLGWTFCDKGAAFAKLREIITATTGGGT